MQKNSFYDHLQELPLFQGLSRNDVSEIVARTKFNFLKFPKNKIIAEEGDECRHLFFLVSGTVGVESWADNRRYAVVEEMQAPDILQPERIFGLSQHFTSTFSAVTGCNIIQLDKFEVLRLSEEYAIFRINLLNVISTRSQRLARFPWRAIPQDIRQKILRFIEMRCLRPAGNKTVVIKMETLAHEIHESRLNVSHTLNAMHNQGEIELSRNTIRIHSLEKLLM